MIVWPQEQQSVNVICSYSLRSAACWGYPLAIEKVDGPATVLDFLGIVLDTERMEARLLKDKLDRIQTTIQEWLNRRSATKREILSPLVGILQHAAKVVCPGRMFVSRMQQRYYFTRLNKEFQSDLHWWNTFLGQWNGVSFFQSKVTPGIVIQTDASGSWGYTAFYGGRWLQ